MILWIITWLYDLSGKLIFYQVVSDIRGSNKGGGWHTCVFLIDCTRNRQFQFHNTIYRIGFGLCRVIEKPPKSFIRHVEVFAFLKRGRILWVVCSHRQHVWAHFGTAARTLIMGSGVCECVCVWNVDAVRWWEWGWMSSWV